MTEQLFEGPNDRRCEARHSALKGIVRVRFANEMNMVSFNSVVIDAEAFLFGELHRVGKSLHELFLAEAWCVLDKAETCVERRALVYLATCRVCGFIRSQFLATRTFASTAVIHKSE